MREGVIPGQEPSSVHHSWRDDILGLDYFVFTVERLIACMAFGAVVSRIAHLMAFLKRVGREQRLIATVAFYQCVYSDDFVRRVIACYDILT